MTTVELVYFNAGGGHRAAARALELAIAARYPDWTVRSTNLFEVLDPRARFERLAGMPPEDVYNKRLARGWTAGLAQELRLFQAAIRVAHRLLVRVLRQHWLRSRPDIVVSLIPNFNLALHDGLRAALPGVPFVTVLTDMADYPPHFWIEPGTTQHVVCGTEMACSQARAAGLSDARIHQMSGMIVRPDFYEPLAVDVAHERREVGLDPQRTAGVVMFGGHGSSTMITLARQLDDVQLILMCGHNKALARKLRAMPSTATHHVVEFTSDVRRYMQLGDFFIGKPGPGSISEAVQQGLPVITIRNAWTMPQERYNADWVLEHGLGMVVASTRKVRPAVLELLADIDEFKANVQRTQNRAVFEVPEILGSILAAGPEPTTRTATGHPSASRLRRAIRNRSVRELIRLKT